MLQRSTEEKNRRHIAVRQRHCHRDEIHRRNRQHRREFRRIHAPRREQAHDAIMVIVPGLLAMQPFVQLRRSRERERPEPAAEKQGGGDSFQARGDYPAAQQDCGKWQV